MGAGTTGGAAAGSAAGPAGTVVGAGIGMLYDAAASQGNPGGAGQNLSRYYDSRWSDIYGGGAYGRQALDPELLAQLRAQAAGTAPSAAELMLRAGLQQQQAQNMGMASGAQGMSPALAFRQAQQANVQAGGQMNQQASVMRAQEQQVAQQQLTQALLQQQAQNDAAAAQYEQLLMQSLAQESAKPQTSTRDWFFGKNSMWGKIKG